MRTRKLPKAFGDTEESESMRCAFGKYDLDTERWAVYRVGGPVDLELMAYQRLVYLVQHA